MNIDSLKKSAMTAFLALILLPMGQALAGDDWVFKNTSTFTVDQPARVFCVRIDVGCQRSTPIFPTLHHYYYRADPQNNFTFTSNDSSIGAKFPRKNGSATCRIEGVTIAQYNSAGVLKRHDTNRFAGGNFLNSGVTDYQFSYNVNTLTFTAPGITLTKSSWLTSKVINSDHACSNY